MNKRFLPLATGLVLTIAASFATALAGEADITPLSNKDVLVMVQNHLSAETIINTIKTSPSTFDTFPPVLKDMKRRGVPDAVLQAMIDAPYGPSRQHSSKEAAGEQAIYHYADQLTKMGFLAPSQISGRTTSFPRQNVRSSRSSRTSIQ